MLVKLDDDTTDEIVRQKLLNHIQMLQNLIEEAQLDEDIEYVWHLMHAFNYFSPPEVHYDVA